jgi:hypothetical protein
LTRLAEAKEKTDDPYRPASPNILYFKEVSPNPSTLQDEQVHYWVLTDAHNVRLSESSYFFDSKDNAIANAMQVFGQEIRSGYHTVYGFEAWNHILNHWADQHILAKAAKAKPAKRTAKKAVKKASV